MQPGDRSGPQHLASCFVEFPASHARRDLRRREMAAALARPALAVLELERPFLHLRLEATSERAVLVKHEHLAEEHKEQERERRPAAEAAEAVRLERMTGEHDEGGERRDVGQDRLGGRARPDGLARGWPDRRQREDQETYDPAGVNQLFAAIPTVLCEVGKRAVRDSQRDHRDADPSERQPIRGTGPRGDDHDHREHDHVPRRIRQRDQLCEKLAATAAVDGPKHQQPADHKHRRAHDQRVDQHAQLRDRSCGWAEEREDARHRERDGEQEPRIGQRRKRHVDTDHNLVPRPDRLAHRPAERRQRQQPPAPPQAVGRLAPPRDPARTRSQHRRHHLAEIVDRLRDLDTAELQDQPHEEERRYARDSSHEAMKAPTGVEPDRPPEHVHRVQAQGGVWSVGLLQCLFH